MKKLMIAFAAVAMAVAANAAAVAWTSGAIVDHTGATIADKYTGYTATVAFYTLSGGVYTDVSDTFGGTLSSSTSSKGVYKGTTGTGTSGTYYGQLVITGKDSGGQEWTLTSDYAEFVYDSTAYANKSVNFTTLNAFDQSGTNKGWVAVPEPTSGLLLLIGMAGLALRRRRA